MPLNPARPYRYKTVKSDQAIDTLEMQPSGKWRVVDTVYKTGYKGCGLWRRKGAPEVEREDDDNDDV